MLLTHSTKRFKCMALRLSLGAVVLCFGLSSSAAQSDLGAFIERYADIQQATTDGNRLALSEQLSDAMVAHWSTHQMEEEARETLGGVMGCASAGSGKEQLTTVSWNVELKIKRMPTVQSSSSPIKKANKWHNRCGSSATTLRPTLDVKSRYTAKEWPGAVYYEVLLQHQGNALFTPCLDGTVRTTSEREKWWKRSQSVDPN